ncbi:MAG TPA: hypothetical protein VMV46_02210 [Thermoanaerobaculia bacterium]|nr:hypothetical protein [Thermoanaerobaculia bacterium]
MTDEPVDPIPTEPSEPLDENELESVAGGIIVINGLEQEAEGDGSVKVQGSLGTSFQSRFQKV